MVPRDVAVVIATITYYIEYQSKYYKEHEPPVAFINLMFLFWGKVSRKFIHSMYRCLDQMCGLTFLLFPLVRNFGM